jgi:hypothetical protein
MSEENGMRGRQDNSKRNLVEKKVKHTREQIEQFFSLSFRISFAFFAKQQSSSSNGI